MADDRPPTIDPPAAERWAQAAPARSPWLHEEVARRMEDRLQWIRLQPAAWADWGPVRGGLQAHALLSARYPRAAAYVAEGHTRLAQAAIKSIAKPMWNPARWLGAPTHFALPGDGAVQMLWANMALHMAPDPCALIAQWHRALATDGFLMFSAFGPDTLRELRALYGALGWPPPAHEFTDMHDWGDMLVQAGFAEPVMDMERIVLTWESPQRLLAELRELGANLHVGRHPALRGRRWRDALERELAAKLTVRGGDPAQDGRLALTFEIIYGHALKAAPRVRMDNESAVSLPDMRAMLRSGRGAQG